MEPKGHVLPFCSRITLERPQSWVMKDRQQQAKNWQTFRTFCEIRGVTDKVSRRLMTQRWSVQIRPPQPNNPMGWKEPPPCGPFPSPGVTQKLVQRGTNSASATEPRRHKGHYQTEAGQARPGGGVAGAERATRTAASIPQPGQSSTAIEIGRAHV